MWLYTIKNLTSFIEHRNMKTLKLIGSFWALSVLLAVLALTGCVPGTSTSPRKKMPEFNESQLQEGPMPFNYRGNIATGNSDFRFVTNNVDMEIDGNMQHFVSVALPDANNDPLAISLLESFKPLALPLLTAWAQQQRNGVVIDLSSHASFNTNRTNYAIKKNNDFSIPVVIVWDEASASRVALLRSMAEGLPSVAFTYISGTNPLK
jgi:hypothetical protein